MRRHLATHPAVPALWLGCAFLVLGGGLIAPGLSETGFDCGGGGTCGHPLLDAFGSASILAAVVLLVTSAVLGIIDAPRHRT